MRSMCSLKWEVCVLDTSHLNKDSQLILFGCWSSTIHTKQQLSDIEAFLSEVGHVTTL